jgi:hypothetical protein
MPTKIIGSVHTENENIPVREELVFAWADRQFTLDVKNALAQAGIEVSSIKLHVKVVLRKQHRYASYTEVLEDRRDLQVPLEDFTEELNDAEEFELYTESAFAEEAKLLVKSYCKEQYPDDPALNGCVFMSANKDESADIQQMLEQNNIPCLEIEKIISEETGLAEYALYVTPEHEEAACALIEEEFADESGE